MRTSKNQQTQEHTCAKARTRIHKQTDKCINAQTHKHTNTHKHIQTHTYVHKESLNDCHKR